MGTIIDKLRYLLDTKNLIKQAIIDSDVQTESTRFRDYPDLIRSIPRIQNGVLQCTPVHIEKVNNAVEIGYKNDVLNVQESPVIIQLVNSEDVYQITASITHDEEEYGSGGD